MFIFILLAHSCIFALVNSNPLPGFPSYPVIQYDGNYYRNDQPIFIQSSDFNPYSHTNLIQNQVTPYPNIPISYNDVHSIYLEDILQNRINSAVNGNCGQTRLYSNAAEKLVPNVVNNYIIVPVESSAINETKDCNKKVFKSKSLNNRKSLTPNENHNPTKKKKCKKRKNIETKENIEKCSIGKRNKRIEKDNTRNKQSHDKDVKVCKKKKSRNKLQNTDTLTDNENSGNEKQIRDKNSKLYPENNLNVSSKKSNKICKASKYDEYEENIAETVKIDPSNNCRNVRKNDNFCDCNQIQKLDDYFNIEEDCAEFNSRCTRNYREDNVQKYQQQYYLPSDFSINMSPYMMFDQQLFDTSGYFPYNFDYLYKMQQSPKANTNSPQKKSNSSRRTGRRRKQKRGSKNTDQNKQNSKLNANCEKILELSPIVFDVQPSVKIGSAITAPVDEKQIEEIYQDVLPIKREEMEISLTSQGDAKEIESDGSYELNQDDYSSIYDDYYPQFHSDNIYTSKEVFDWDSFNERHYYTSSDMNELDRERRKFENLDGAITPSQINILKANDFKPYIYTKIDSENQEKQEFSIKLNNKEQNDNVQYKLSSEEIQFKTPPALDFPDFKTEMVNKEQLIPQTEVYYQPNNNEVNKYKNNKMSSYSITKMAESNENINKIVSQNEVETVYGHSKVAKYGTPSKKAEYNTKFSDGNNYNNDTYTRDEKPFVVIAKSLPYPID